VERNRGSLQEEAPIAHITEEQQSSLNAAGLQHQDDNGINSPKQTPLPPTSVIFPTVLSFLQYLSISLSETHESPQHSASSFIEYAQDFSYLMRRVDEACEEGLNIEKKSQDSNSDNLFQNFSPSHVHNLSASCYIFGAEAYFEMGGWQDALHCLELAEEAKSRSDECRAKEQQQRNNGRCQEQRTTTVTAATRRRRRSNALTRSSMRGISSPITTDTSPYNPLTASSAAIAARIHAMKSIAYGRLTRMDKCLELAQEAVSIVLESYEPTESLIDDHVLDAMYLAGMTQWKHHSNHEQARIWLEMGVKYASERGDVPRFMETSAGLLGCLLDVGRFSAAIDFYNEMMAENEDVINELIDERSEAAYVRNFVHSVNRLQSVENLNDLNLDVPQTTPTSPSDGGSVTSLRGKPPSISTTNSPRPMSPISPIHSRVLSTTSVESGEGSPRASSASLFEASFSSANDDSVHMEQDSAVMNELEQSEMIFNRLYFDVMEETQDGQQSQALDDKYVAVLRLGESIMYQIAEKMPHSPKSSLTSLRSTILGKMRSILNALYTSLVHAQLYTDALAILERSRHMSMMAQLYPSDLYFADSSIGNRQILPHAVHPCSTQMLEIAQAENATVVLYGTKFNSFQGGQDYLDIWVVNPWYNAPAHGSDHNQQQGSPTPGTPKAFTPTSDLGLPITSTQGKSPITGGSSPATSSGTKNKKKKTKKTPNRKPRRSQGPLIIRKGTDTPRIEVTKKILELQSIIIQLSLEMDHSQYKNTDLHALVDILSTNRSHERFTELLVELYDLLIAPIEHMLPVATTRHSGKDVDKSAHEAKHTKSSRSSHSSHSHPERLIILPEDNMHYVPFIVLRNPRTEQYMFESHLLSLCACFKHIQKSSEQYQQTLDQKQKQQDFNSLAQALYGKYENVLAEQTSSPRRMHLSSSSSFSTAEEHDYTSAGSQKLMPHLSLNTHTMEVNSLAIEVEDNHFYEEETSPNSTKDVARLSQSSLGRVSPMCNRDSLMSIFSLFVGDADYIFELHAQIRQRITECNAKSFLTSTRLHLKEEVLYFLRHQALSPVVVFVGWPGTKREKSFIQTPKAQDESQLAKEKSVLIFSIPDEDDDEYTHTDCSVHGSEGSATNLRDNEQQVNHSGKSLVGENGTSSHTFTNNHIVNVREFSQIDFSGTLLLVVDQASSMQTPVDEVDSFNMITKSACERGASCVMGSLWNASFPMLKKSFYSRVFSELTLRRTAKDEAMRDALVAMVNDEPSLLRAPWLFGGAFLFGTCKPLVMM